jgi:L-lysine 6-oxidase
MSGITYRIHPALGVARVGNAPDSYYLEPTRRGGLPTEIGPNGEEHPVTRFKDAGQVRRQAARFRIYCEEPGKAPVEVSLRSGLRSVRWTVHVANKKAAWYEFSELQGDVMLGADNTYEQQGVALRNPTVTGDAPRRGLIVDPGPRTVSTPGDRAEFDAASAGDYPHVSFPPTELAPYAVTTLGTISMNDDGSLLVLGGFGHSGGPQGSNIDTFAGADGWYDDVSDGPVIADIETDDGDTFTIHAWVVTGAPKLAPELNNITSLADTLIDIGVRYMGLCPALHSAPSGYNPAYVACLERDVLPIVQAMKEYRWVANVDAMVSFATPPFDLRDMSEANRSNRTSWFEMLRDPGERRLAAESAPSHQQLTASNDFPMMPLNSGDNSISNTFIEKFMALTPTQYFLLSRWAAGRCESIRDNPSAGQDWGWVNPIDHASAANVVGEPMAPGIEVTWTTRNPDIFVPGDPFRVKLSEDGYANGLSPWRDETVTKTGCEPGDLTKRMAIPWQADFYDCSVQAVNFTTPGTNKTISNASRIPLAPTFYAFWWPAQSPYNVYDGATTAADQALDAGQMFGQNVPYHRGLNSFLDAVVGWKYLGFILNRTQGEQREMLPFFVEQERNYEAFQFGVMGLTADGDVYVTQPATTTTAADVGARTQNQFPLQWLVGN